MFTQAFLQGGVRVRAAASWGGHGALALACNVPAPFVDAFCAVLNAERQQRAAAERVQLPAFPCRAVPCLLSHTCRWRACKCRPNAATQCVRAADVLRALAGCAGQRHGTAGTAQGSLLATSSSATIVQPSAACSSRTGACTHTRHWIARTRLHARTHADTHATAALQPSSVPPHSHTRARITRCNTAAQLPSL